MNCHDILNKLTVVYGHAYDLKRRAIEVEHKHPIHEDIVADMQEVLYRIDKLSKRAAEQLNQGG
jgi:hypothetical protein